MPQKKTKQDRPLRVDAARNRARLLLAADKTFTELGANASFEDVAKRAKVGIGTVYRHFATHEALLAAACDERLLTIAAETRAADESDDIVDQLASYLERLAWTAAMYNGLAASFGVVLGSHTPGCDATTAEGARLLSRAKKEKRIESDLKLDDIVCVITAVALAAKNDRPRVRRLVRLFMDGMRRL